jgi:hypothetical protein
VALATLYWKAIEAILTLRRVFSRVAQLEEDDIFISHAFLVEPAVLWIVQQFVCFVKVMRKDDVRWDDVFGRNTAEITQCKRAVLMRRSYWTPNAEETRTR